MFKKTILVTGGSGFIGGYLVNYLRNKGFIVYYFDKVNSNRKDKYFIHGDLTSLKDVKKIFQKNKYDCVIHLAALTNARESLLKPVEYFENNVLGTKNLLQILSLQKKKNIIFASSSSVYGDLDAKKIKERMLTLPISPYGESKIICEKLLEWYLKVWGVKYTVLRLFNVVGADENFGGDSLNSGRIITEACLVATGKKRKFIMNGNPNSVRDYVHVDDVSSLCYEIIKKNKYTETYNVGSGTGTSNKEIINLIRKISGVDLEVEENNKSVADPNVVIADISKAKKELGWKPASSRINRIVADSWKWYSSLRNV